MTPYILLLRLRICGSGPGKIDSNVIADTSPAVLPLLMRAQGAGAGAWKLYHAAELTSAGACRMRWSMPNLASMLLEGLQRAQLPGPQQQQQQPESLQSKSFSFPRVPSREALGFGWGQQRPAQATTSSPTPLALLAAAAQIADCLVSARA